MTTVKFEPDQPERKGLNQLHYLGIAFCVAWIITLDRSSPDVTIAAPYFGIIAATLGLVVNQRVSFKLASWLFIAPIFAASLWTTLFFGAISFAPHLILVSIMGFVAFQSPQKSQVYVILAAATFLVCSLSSPQYALLGLTRPDIDAFLTRPNAGLAESLLLTYIILCLYVLTAIIHSKFTENLSRRAQFLQERFESARNRFLAQTAIHRFLPRALLVLDQTDRIIGASYVFLSQAGMSMESVEGKRLSDILRSPANVDIDLDQKSALVNLTTATDAAPALAKIHRSTILGRKLQTVLDIEFPRAEERFTGAATGYVGDVQAARHIFDRYLQQDNTIDTRTVIRLRCIEYPALFSRFGKSVADDALISYIERLPESGVQATLRLSGSTTALLLTDSEAHETVMRESKQRLFTHTIRIFEEEWQIKFELKTLRSPLDFTDSRSFFAAGSASLVDPADAVLRERVLNQISGQGFLFHFQPIHRSTASHEILFCEGLARWKGSDPLPPPVFIEIANQLGLGRALTKRLITAFCKAYEELNQQSGTTQTVSLNMSALDIQDETLRSHLKNQVAAFRLNPTHIVVELIETQRIENIASFVTSIQDLKQHGFKIAIDDFGKAFSSIERLMQIPFDYVKLDGSLCSATTAKNSAPLLKMIVNLAKELKIPVIAEGIEDKRDLNYINELGILWSQGYFFSRPADPVASATMLRGARNA